MTPFPLIILCCRIRNPVFLANPGFLPVTLPGWGRPEQPRLLPLLSIALFHFIIGTDKHENDKGNDQEIQNGLNKGSVADLYGLGQGFSGIIHFGGAQGVGQLSKVHVAQRQADGRHDNIGGEGGDNGLEGTPAMITATANSSTLPRIMKSLNSFSMMVTSWFLKMDCRH